MLTELPYFADSARLFESVADEPWAVLLDSGRRPLSPSRYDIITAQPHTTLVTRGTLTEIRSRNGVELSRDDPLQLLGRHLQPATPNEPELPFCGGALGYFGYDLARHWHALPVVAQDAEHLPEMAVGIYDWAVVVDHLERRSWLASAGRDAETERLWPALIGCFSRPAVERARLPFRLTAPLASNFTPSGYAAAFARIHDYIRAGDCYQVNLAQRFAAPAQGDPWLLYQALRVVNPAPFSAYLHTPDAHILSASPESFLRVRAGQAETRPIKGTRARNGHPRLDAEIIETLRQSEKDRAENLMIVDLLRNDFAKNCDEVRVSKLFEVESYATVHHLVSTVTGRLKPGHSALDLLRGCFPGGSITGAPKLRAMQIIEELEPHRRGIYCGAIGYLGYNGDMDLNIAIRTLVYSHQIARFWAGGGIVADSDPAGEYQETFDKAAALVNLLQRNTASNLG
ncbi:MAG: aminodeoxychorismate synthase component I [Pseudomonadota bacterium]